MTTSKSMYYRCLFSVAAIYDVLLGISFTIFPTAVFRVLSISEKQPAFGGYITLLGAFVLVIGIAYFLIAVGDLHRNADLILVGTLYKLGYAATAFYYLAAGGLPHIAFAAVFGVADAVFCLLMAECYLFLRRKTAV